MKRMFARTLSALLALLVVVSMPLTAMAVTVNASWGDVTIGNENVTHTPSEGAGQTTEAHNHEVIIQNSSTTEHTVSVNMSDGAVAITGDVNGGILASGGAVVTVEGNVTDASSSAAIYADDGASVTVTGDVDGSNRGILAFDTGTSVTVNGNVSGGDGSGTSGSGGVEAWNGANVTVNGNVSGGTGSESSHVSGGVGVSAIGANVTVTGDVTGGDAYGSHNISGGNAVYAGNGASVSVGGNATGGSGTSTGEYAWGGVGVNMESTATVSVGGNVTGGDANGESGSGSEGASIFYKGTEEAGSLTVGGTVTGGKGTGENVTDADDIVIMNFTEGYGDKKSLEEMDMMPVTVGGYNSVAVYEFTDEEAEILAEAITVTGTGSTDAGSTPAVVVQHEAPAQTSTYSKGATWRGGYITRTIYKVENGAGMKPVWEEDIRDGVLTITAENEPVVFTTWLNGLKYLADMGVKTIVIKTANCETELVIADLIAQNGTEYILTQEGETATLTVDGKVTEIE